MPVLTAALHEHVFVSTVFELAGLGALAGWLGAVVGIGGGVVIVPALVLAFGFDTRVAVASSLVAVVASSSAAGSAYVSKGQANMRLAMVLETATTIGGIAGGIVAVLVAPMVIDGVFAVMMVVTAGLIVGGQHQQGGATRETSLASSPTNSQPPPAMALSLAGAAFEKGEILVASGERTGWEERSHLGGAYFDSEHERLVTYRAVRLWIGWVVSFVAGGVSGLLGVGGGFLKVPAMSLGMKVPIKVAAATSNFMIGVTAVASLFVYFTRGYVMPFVAAPVALGVAVGAYGGAKSSQRLSGRTVGRILAAVLGFVAVQMALKAFGVASV